MIPAPTVVLFPNPNPPSMIPAPTVDDPSFDCRAQLLFLFRPSRLIEGAATMRSIETADPTIEIADPLRVQGRGRLRERRRRGCGGVASGGVTRSRATMEGEGDDDGGGARATTAWIGDCECEEFRRRAETNGGVGWKRWEESGIEGTLDLSHSHENCFVGNCCFLTLSYYLANVTEKPIAGAKLYVSCTEQKTLAWNRGFMYSYVNKLGTWLNLKKRGEIEFFLLIYDIVSLIDLVSNDETFKENCWVIMAEGHHILSLDVQIQSNHLDKFLCLRLPEEYRFLVENKTDIITPKPNPQNIDRQSFSSSDSGELR
ncbi:hypothetical protein R6Q59_026369 [Mikania micrantha]